jgi:hypothetical protein
VTELQLIAQHLEALKQGNVEQLLADYDDNAYLIFAGGVIEGKEALSGLFEQFVTGLIPPGSTKWKIQPLTAHKGIVYCRWQACSHTHSILYASDTFVVKDNKIVAQTSVGEITENSAS